VAILTDAQGGLYHFRILLPAEYPFRPPAIQLLTPNGRFELNTNVSCSALHPVTGLIRFHVDLHQLYKLYDCSWCMGRQILKLILQITKSLGNLHGVCEQVCDVFKRTSGMNSHLPSYHRTSRFLSCQCTNWTCILCVTDLM
jgi:ubiquitin-protein ligase